MPRESSFIFDVLWEYDLETLTLSKLASINTAIYSSASIGINPSVGGFPSAAKMVLHDNKIYYFPLYKRSEKDAFIGIFDLNTKEWSEDEISLNLTELAPPITYLGNPDLSVRKYIQLFYVINNQLKIVFENNREVTYDLATKKASVRITDDYKNNNLGVAPSNAIVYNDEVYYNVNSKFGSTINTSYIWYKITKEGKVVNAFPEIVSFPGPGSQFSPIDSNSFIFVGGGGTRYWFEKK